MTVRLTEYDRARVRYHLGYLQTEPTSSIHLGYPAMSQALFLVERAMDNLIPSAVEIVQKNLDHLNSLECMLFDAASRLKVQSVGDVKLRTSNDEPSETVLLEKEIYRWASRLADNLGVPLNPYSERYRSEIRGPNIPVVL
jgi:hypothetical protein